MLQPINIQFNSILNIVFDHIILMMYIHNTTKLLHTKPKMLTYEYINKFDFLSPPFLPYSGNSIICYNLLDYKHRTFLCKNKYMSLIRNGVVKRVRTIKCNSTLELKRLN